MRTFTRTALTTTAIAGLLTAGAAGVAHAAPAGTAQTFQLHYNSAVSDQTGQVIGHGPINGAGSDEENITDTGGHATFTFRDGTLVLNVHIGSETPTLDLTACRATVALEGTWEIDHGTGAYAAATGSGTYSGTRMIHGTRIKGVCQGPDSGVEPRMSTENVVLTGAVSAGWGSERRLARRQFSERTNASRGPGVAVTLPGSRLAPLGSSKGRMTTRQVTGEVASPGHLVGWAG